MKKTILISIMASAVVFGAEVTSLTENMTNTIKNGTLITNSCTVEQGKTEITGGDSEVNGLTIMDEDRGNVIDSIEVSGGNIDQGKTKVNMGKFPIPIFTIRIGINGKWKG